MWDVAIAHTHHIHTHAHRFLDAYTHIHLITLTSFIWLLISSSGVSFDEEMDYDDEVDSQGNIDLGEISSQYLSLELF